MAPVPVAKTQWGPVHSASFPEVWDKPVFSSGLGVLREALGGDPQSTRQERSPTGTTGLGGTPGSRESRLLAPGHLSRGLGINQGAMSPQRPDVARSHEL